MQYRFYNHYKMGPFPVVMLKTLDNNQFKVVEVNAAFLRLLGLSHREVVGMDLDELYQVHAEARCNISVSLIKTSLEYVKTYKTTRIIRQFYFSKRKPDGLLQEYNMEVTSIPILNDYREVEYILQLGKQIPLEKPVLEMV